ncbi:MAG: DUF433 domain-containing protein [Isosphaeraceae bacterium]
MDALIAEHITKTPGVCGGEPRIAGHRVRVQDVAVWYERMGMCPAEIIDQYPALTLGDIHAALAYYYDNQEMIDERISAEGRYIAEVEARTPPLVKQKRSTKDAQNDRLTTPALRSADRASESSVRSCGAWS